MIVGGLLVPLSALFHDLNQAHFWVRLVVCFSLGIVLGSMQEPKLWCTVHRAILICAIFWIPVISYYMVCWSLTSFVIGDYFKLIVNTFSYFTSNSISAEPAGPGLDYFKLVVNVFDYSSSSYMLYTDPFCFFVFFLIIIFFWISSVSAVFAASFGATLLFAYIKKIHEFGPTDLDKLRNFIARIATVIAVVTALWNALG
jgi:hypothetical protein